MAKYSISFTRSALKDFESLPPAVQKRIGPAIDGLAMNPRPSGVKKLQVEFLYRIRVGDYRVVYAISDEVRIVLITDVGHRSRIYR